MSESKQKGQKIPRQALGMSEFIMPLPTSRRKKALSSSWQATTEALPSISLLEQCHIFTVINFIPANNRSKDLPTMMAMNIQSLVHQGLSLMDAGDVEHAIRAFQKAGKEITSSNYDAPSVVEQLDMPGIPIPPPSTGISFAPISEESNPYPYSEVESFQQPFHFTVHGATEASNFTQNQLASCTAVLLFNLALCHQLKFKFALARKLYEKSWACTRRYQGPLSLELLVLQMAISLNNSVCLDRLGLLDTSFQWMVCLQNILSLYTQTPDANMGDQFNFFFMSTIVRKRRIAANAA